MITLLETNYKMEMTGTEAKQLYIELKKLPKSVYEGRPKLFELYVVLEREIKFSD